MTKNNKGSNVIGQRFTACIFFFHCYFCLAAHFIHYNTAAPRRPANLVFTNKFGTYAAKILSHLDSIFIAKKGEFLLLSSVVKHRWMGCLV